MDRQKLEEWVQDKLDSGVEPERVKKSLEETDHDPSIVDKITSENDEKLEENQEETVFPEEERENLEEKREPHEVEETEEEVKGFKSDFHSNNFDPTEVKPEPENKRKDQEKQVTKTGLESGYEESKSLSESESGVDRENMSSEPDKFNQESSGSKGSEKPASIDVSHRKEELEKIGKTFEKGVERGLKPLVAVLLIVGVLAGGFMYSDQIVSAAEISNPLGDGEKAEKEKDKVPEASLSDRQEPNITGEEVEVVLTEKLAKPSRASINSSEGVRLVNNASRSYNVSFDSSIKSFVLPAGKSWLIAPDSITYYSAKPLGEGETVKGSVYVE